MSFCLSSSLTSLSSFSIQHLASWATQERHRSEQVTTTSLAVGSVGGLIGGLLLGCATAPLWAVPAVAVSGACVGGAITHNIVIQVTDTLHYERMMMTERRTAAAGGGGGSRQDVIQLDVDSSSDDDDDDEALMGSSSIINETTAVSTTTSTTTTTI